MSRSEDDPVIGRSAADGGAATSAPAGHVIDVHAHTIAPSVDALVKGRPGLIADMEAQARTFGAASMARNLELATGAYVPLLTDLPTRLAWMRSARVDMQAISIIPTQYHYWASEQLAADIVSAVNGHIADLVSARPDHLVGLGTVALQHPDLAVEQLRQAMGALGLRGVEISTNAGGRDLSDPVFDPFWAEAEALGAFVFIHPWGCSLGERLSPFYLGNVIGQPIETTLALSHLIFGGVFDRYPGLRVCGAHGGGYLPYYAGRADHAWEVRPESRTTVRAPSSYLRQIWFDSLVYRPDTLRQLIDVAGPGQVLLGTDYPFDMGVSNPLQRLEEVGDLEPDDQARIAGLSAASLLDIDGHRTLP